MKDYRGTCQSRHYIRADAVEQVVMLELARLALFLREDEEAFAELLAKKTEQDAKSGQKLLQDDLQRINPNYKADLRRGVAVEYIPRPA